MSPQHLFLKARLLTSEHTVGLHIVYTGTTLAIASPPAVCHLRFDTAHCPIGYRSCSRCVVRRLTPQLVIATAQNQRSITVFAIYLNSVLTVAVKVSNHIFMNL